MVDEQFKRATCLSTGVISLFLSLVTTAGNGVLLYMLYKDPLRCLRKPVTVFVGALAVVDFLTGMISDVAFAVHEFYCVMGVETQPGAIGNFSGISYFFTVNSALLLVAALSIERLIAVAFPHYYRRAVTPRKILVLVAVIYVHAFVFAMLQLAKIPDEIYHNMDLNFHITLPVSTVSIMYTVIYTILRKRRKVTVRSIAAAPAMAVRRNRSLAGSTSDARREARNLKIEQKLVTTAFIILVCMIIALIPYLVFVYLEIGCPTCIDTRWFFICRRLCVPFLFINSSVNPFIYAWRLQNYRRSFKALIVGSDNRPSVFSISETQTANSLRATLHLEVSMNAVKSEANKTLFHVGNTLTVKN